MFDPNQSSSTDQAETKAPEQPKTGSENYFERCNAEFDRAIKTGEILDKENLIKEIVSSNETSLFKKILDAIHAPEEAIKWFSKQMIMEIGGQWLDKIKGIGREVREAREKISGLITNPFKIIEDALKSIGDFEIFQTMKINPNNFDWLKGMKGEMIAAAGGLGATIFGLGKLAEYIKQNPDFAKGFPSSAAEKESWWKKLLEQLGISEKSNLILDIVTGRKKFTDLFQKDGQVKPAGAEAPAAGAPDDASKINEQNGKIEHQRYGELAPREEVIKKYHSKLEAWFLEVKSFVIDHKTTLIAAAITAGSVSAVRTLASSTTKFSLESLLLIAKIPFKSKKNFLLSSVLTLTGFLLFKKEFAIQYKNQSYLPVNADKLTEFTTDKVRQLKPQFPEELENISDSAISEISTLVTDPKTEFDKVFPKIEEAVFKLGKSSIELIGETDQYIIRNNNLGGLDQLRRLVEIHFKTDENFDRQAYQTFMTGLSALNKEIREGKKLTIELINQHLEESSFKLGIDFAEEEGFFVWLLVDPVTRIQLPESAPIRFGVNGILPESKQLDLSFLVSKKHAAERALEGVTTEFRRGISNWLLTDLDSEQQQNQQIKEQILSGKWAIVAKGGYYFLVNLVEGVFVKNIQMPAELIQLIFQHDQASWDEFAVDYGRGIIPVAILSIAKVAYSPSKILNTFSKGTIINLIKLGAYPITGTYETGKLLWDITRHKQLGGNLSDFYEKPIAEILSGLNYRKNAILKLYHSKKIDIGLAGSSQLTGIHEQLSRLYQAKEKASRMLYVRLNQETEKLDIKEILEQTKLEKKDFDTDQADTLIREIEKKIYLYEARLEAIERIHLLEKSKINFNKGENEAAIELLKKAGYSEITDLEQLNQKLSELKDFAINSDLIKKLEVAQDSFKHNKIKDAKRVLRQAGFDETLTPEQIAQKIEELKLTANAEKVPTDLAYLEGEIKNNALRRSRGPETVAAGTEKALPEGPKTEAETELSRAVETEIAGKNQDEIAQIVAHRDAELTVKTEAIDKEIAALMESSGGRATPELAAKIEELKIAHDSHLAEHLGFRSEIIKKLDPETIKSHGLETAENYAIKLRERIKVDTPKLRTKLRTAARSLVGHTAIAAAVAVGLTLLFIGTKEALADDTETVNLEGKFNKPGGADTSIDTGTETKTDSPAESAEAEETLGMELKSIKQYLVSKERIAYREISEILGDIAKINDVSEERFIEVVNKTAAEHNDAITHIKNILQQNADKITDYYRKFPEDAKKHFHRGDHFILDFNREKNSLEFKYADGDEYKKYAYARFDDQRRHQKDYLAGTPPGTVTRVAEAAERVIPVNGFLMDYSDAYLAGKRGEYGDMAANIGWGTLGVVSDVALVLTPFTATVSGWLSGGAKALRLASIGGRSAKVIKEMAVIGKVAPAAIGITAATYQTFKSPFNKSFEIKL